MWVPVGCVVIEFFINRLQVRFQSMGLQAILTLVYLLTTLVGEELTGEPIYAEILNWECKNDDACYTELLQFIIYMFSIQIGFVILFVLLHWIKTLIIGSPDKAAVKAFDKAEKAN